MPRGPLIQLLKIAVVFALACSSAVHTPPPRDSQPQVHGGGPADGYPAVVELLPRLGERCTATFVSQTTVITAAHCVTPAAEIDSAPENGADAYLEAVGTEGEIVLSKRVFHAGATGGSPMYVFLFAAHKDVAVGVFSRKDAARIIGKPRPSEYPRLMDHSKPLKEGTDVTYVGYGRGRLDDETGSTGGTKRVSRDENAVTAVEDAEIRTRGKAGILAGDSGGPLFIGGRLAGVASRTEEESSTGKVTNIHVKLSHPKVREVLRRAVRNGARIPGVQ